MPVDLGTNINVRPPYPLEELDPANTALKVTRSLQHNAGITNISEAEEIFASFSPLTKPTLTAPTVSLTEAEEVVLDENAARLLQIGTHSNVLELTQACLAKLQHSGLWASDPKEQNKSALEKAAFQFDDESMECLCLLLTMGSKSKLVETLKEALKDKIRVRDEINQKYLKETIEVNAKNVKAKNDQIAAEKKRKAWGIFGAIVSAIVTIVATVATVMTCGAASPLGVLAIAGCTACLASSSLTIAAACVTDPVLKEKLQTAATILGIIGTLLTIISSVGAYNAAAKAAQKAATEGVMIEMADLGSQAANAGKVAVGAENAAQAAINGVGKWQAFKNLLSSICTVKAGAQQIPYLQTINAVFASITGVTSGVTNIINSANEMRLSELEKQLAESKINQKKIDQEIAVLSKAIEICSNNLQQCIQDILANEEKAAQTIQQMMDTSLKLDRQIGC